MVSTPYTIGPGIKRKNPAMISDATLPALSDLRASSRVPRMSRVPPTFPCGTIALSFAE